MRKKCTIYRSKRPDDIFIESIANGEYYQIQSLEYYDEEDDFNFDQFECEFDEDDFEEYEDELILANRRAGFVYDDDGELIYDEQDEEDWE